MGDVAGLKEALSALKPNYKQEALTPIQDAMCAVVVDNEDTAEKVCVLLGELKIPDAAALLAVKWPDLPPKLRYVFQRLEWCGRKRGRDLYGALALSQRLASADSASAAFFIEHALSRYKERPSEHGEIFDSLRKTWLAPSGQPPQLPLCSMDPQLVRSDWRWLLTKLSVDAIGGGGADGKWTSTNARGELAIWIERLADAPDSRDRDALLEQRDRLQQISQPAKQLQQQIAADAPPPPADKTTTGSDVMVSSSNRVDGTPTRSTVSTATASSDPTGPAAAANNDSTRRRRTHVDGDGQRRPNTLRQIAMAIESLTQAWAKGRAEFERTVDGEPNARQLEEITSLQTSLTRAEATAGQLLRDLEAERSQHRAAASAAADAAERLSRLEEQIRQLQADLELTRQRAGVAERELEALRVRGEATKDAHVKNLDLERAAERRVMGEQIGRAIAEDLRTLRDVAKQPEEPDTAKFVITVAQDMVRRLAQHGIPVDR